jgi:putative sigma-54 modulation protein
VINTFFKTFTHKEAPYMQTSVTFKNIDPSDHLKSYVSEKLNRFDKYLYNPAEAYVVLSVEKFRHIAEINIVGDRLSINGKEETEDMYSAIDMTLDKLEKQIKKNKQKTRERRAGKGKSKPNPDTALVAMEEDNEKQVVVKNIDYKPMDVDEAIMQMDLMNGNFLVFTNARSDQVNVLYRRNDGDFGLIQPSH